MEKSNLDMLLQQLLREVEKNIMDYINRVAPKFPGVFSGAQVMPSYKILGLEGDVTSKQLEHRYRELAKLLHPDTCPVKGTTFLLALVNAAYTQIKKEKGW